MIFESKKTDLAITTFSQNFEDVVLFRVLADIKNGFYIDAGAGDPNLDSVTKLFYERGWNGINIEPLHNNHQEFIKFRPRDINLNCAVGEFKQTGLLNKSLGIGGLSTLSIEVADQYRIMGLIDETYEVKIFSLNEIILEYRKYKEVHFLKIDVEGYERKALLGIDLDRFRPWVICIESIDPISRKENWIVWEKLVIQKNYLFAYADGLNRFYLALEHLDRLKHFLLPPNIFDSGNS